MAYIEANNICNGKDTWLDDLNNILSYFKLNEKKPIGYCTLKWNNIADQLRYSFGTNWKNYLDKNKDNQFIGNKLRFYRSFKESIKQEQYLLNIKNQNFRAALTKIRISAHPFAIEKDRY